jgi:hypothetical protein
LPLHQKAKSLEVYLDGQKAIPRYSYDYGVTSFSMVVPDGVHRIKLTPVNVNNLPSSGFDSSEVGIIVGPPPNPSFTITSPKSGSQVEYDDFGNWVFTLNYANLENNLLLDEDERVSYLSVRVTQLDNNVYVDSRVDFGTTTINFPSGDPLNDSYNDYQVVITPKNAQDQTTTKVVRRSLYFTRY